MIVVGNKKILFMAIFVCLISIQTKAEDFYLTVAIIVEGRTAIIYTKNGGGLHKGSTYTVENNNHYCALVTVTEVEAGYVKTHINDRITSFQEGFLYKFKLATSLEIDSIMKRNNQKSKLSGPDDSDSTSSLEEAKKNPVANEERQNRRKDSKRNQKYLKNNQKSVRIIENDFQEIINNNEEKDVFVKKENNSEESIANTITKKNENKTIEDSRPIHSLSANTTPPPNEKPLPGISIGRICMLAVLIFIVIVNMFTMINIIRNIAWDNNQ